jgi:DNA repair protein RadC
MDDQFLPELDLLVPLLGSTLAQIVASQPGGWRTLSLAELEAMGVSSSGTQKVLALQQLVCRGYPRLPANQLLGAEDVARCYEARLGGLETERLVVVALDGRCQLLGEFVVATGGCGSLSVTAADILRPLIRSGARATVLVHNHPSGDPTPSGDDVRMTRAAALAAHLVGLDLHDHIIVGARGGGWRSMRQLGLMEKEHEDRPAESTVLS